MTTPGMSAEAQDPTIMTTPGIAVQAKRLPIPVADYVTIGLNELDIKNGIRYPWLLRSRLISGMKTAWF